MKELDLEVYHLSWNINLGVSKRSTVTIFLKDAHHITHLLSCPIRSRHVSIQKRGVLRAVDEWLQVNRRSPETELSYVHERTEVPVVCWVHVRNKSL